jgi:hypothetical protein
MIFFLLCVFIGQEPATDTEKVSVQKMFELGTQYARNANKNAVAQVNAKIAFLAFVKKTKPNPEHGFYVYQGYDWEKQEGANFRASFNNQKEKAEYEKKLRQEILDAKKVLLNARKFVVSTINSQHLGPFGSPFEEEIEVVRVLDDDSCVFYFKPYGFGKPHLLTGMKTKGISDDTRVQTNHIFVENGTAKPGLTTYSAYRVVTDEEQNEIARLVEGMAPESSEKIRAWESADRKHSTLAKLVGFDLKTVKLEKEDGEIAELPLAKLSKEDQSYVQRALGLEPMDVP